VRQSYKPVAPEEFFKLVDASHGVESLWVGNLRSNREPTD